MSDAIHRTKLSEDVAELILSRIRSRLWTEGTRLPSEPELAALFDVSRATIRSAIHSLQLSGILYSRSGSGTYVSDSAQLILETKDLALIMADPENLFSLVQARYILEPQLAALAAKNATKDEVSILYEIIQKMEQDHNKHALMSNGYQFHQTVAQLSHNRVLYGFFLSAANQLRGLRVLDSLGLETFLEGIEAHKAIACAIYDGDAALAKQLMRSHLKKDYLQYLDRAEILD